MPTSEKNIQFHKLEGVTNSNIGILMETELWIYQKGLFSKKLFLITNNENRKPTLDVLANSGIKCVKLDKIAKFDFRRFSPYACLLSVLLYMIIGESTLIAYGEDYFAYCFIPFVILAGYNYSKFQTLSGEKAKILGWVDHIIKDEIYLNTVSDPKFMCHSSSIHNWQRYQ